MGIVKDILYKLSPNSTAFFKKRSIFPYYHIVRDQKVAHIEFLYEYKNEAAFRSDLDSLVRDYEAIDPQALLDGDKPQNGFLLTFDDGLAEIYTVIFPILREKGIKAAFFINPNFVDNAESLYKHDLSILLHGLKSQDFPKQKMDEVANACGFTYENTAEFIQKAKNVKYSNRGILPKLLEVVGVDHATYLREQKLYVSREQIREMLDAGHFFGGHTLSHPPLEQLDFEAQKKEIIGSIEWMKTTFGIPYSMFAFPFSDKKVSARLLEALFSYDPQILLFGNSGLKQDVSSRIIQRFSIENPNRKLKKLIAAENLYMLYNKAIGQYKIRRK